MEKKWPKVSLLIPIYKVEAYVEECLHSVLAQNYPNLEIILLDDASPDRSMSIVKDLLKEETAHTVQILSHSQNRGLAAARSSSLQVATGEYLMFLDSDDYWASDQVVMKCVEKMEEDSSDLLVFNYTNLLGRRLHMETLPLIYNPIDLVIAYLRGEVPAFLCNKCFRRDFFLQRANCWIEGKNLWEDMQNVVPYTLETRKISYLSDHFLVYRRLMGSVSNQLSPQVRESILEIHEQIKSRVYTSEQYKGLKDSLDQAIFFQRYLAKMIQLKTHSFNEFKKIVREDVDLHECAKQRKGFLALWDRFVLFFSAIKLYRISFLLYRWKYTFIRLFL